MNPSLKAMMPESRAECCDWLSRVAVYHEGGITEGYTYDFIARQVYGEGYPPELSGRIRNYAHRISVRAKGFEQYNLPDVRPRSRYEYHRDN